MNLTSWFTRIGAALLVGAACASEQAPTEEEVVLVHELRSAFYERAPRTLAIAMTKATASWCATDSKTVLSSDDVRESIGWLCKRTTHHYFRSVYINGHKGRHGLVCEQTQYKYLGMDLAASLLEDHECLPAEFDGTSYHLIVDPESAGANDA